MTESFAPRTVAIVALASLVGGFVVVFGGGMVVLRPQAALSTPTAEPPARSAADASRGTAPGRTAPDVAVPSDDAGEDASEPSVAAGDDTAGDGGPGTAEAASVAVAPAAISRCFDQGPSAAAIPGAHCDPLTALDQHFTTHAAAIAACGHGHGHLGFVMDFRFSTSFVRAWGTPTSTIANAGVVAACVRRVTAPLPLASVPHAHDRYVLAYGIDWR